MITILPDSEAGKISFETAEICCIEEFWQNEKTTRANIYLKNGMAVTIENDSGAAVDYAKSIFQTSSPNLTILVSRARIKRAERTLSFQL
jgi:hypothetical protein